MSRQHSQSRENINFPEDDTVGGSEGGGEDTGGATSPGKTKLNQTPVFKPKAGLCMSGSQLELKLHLIIKYSLNTATFESPS